MRTYAYIYMCHLPWAVECTSTVRRAPYIYPQMSPILNIKIPHKKPVAYLQIVRKRPTICCLLLYIQITRKSPILHIQNAQKRRAKESYYIVPGGGTAYSSSLLHVSFAQSVLYLVRLFCSYMSRLLWHIFEASIPQSVYL